MRRVWIHIALLLILSACVKEADWSVPENGNNYIVVDGIITSEAKTQYIFIHNNKAGLNDATIPISGAVVIISNEVATYQLYEDAEEAGRYITDSIVAAQLDKNYSLLIFYQEKIFSAQAYMVTGKAFPELSYKKNDDDELYSIDYVASSFETEDPAMWEILVDWSSVPGYENENLDDCMKKMLFYTLPTLDVSQVFAPALEQISFPAGSKIDQRRYSLTPEHAAFVRSLLLETSWQGGVFPSDPANVSTNLSDGALGFFGVCAVNSLSLIVTAEKNTNFK
ncbi:MAG: hypothetical protein DRJ15_06730 [Bacteroidetes bacterium]|nr:MAG: hypothetical protein DRI83_00935 [Bacteroidota bacterium]RLD80573.1 MAG: hypothetical protein DRJ15_06730 [Bacteroidota bacterium]